MLPRIQAVFLIGEAMSEHADCYVEPIEKPLDQAALHTAEVTFLSVSGMGCPRCAIRVRNGLLLQDAVLFADVYLQKGIVIVAYAPGQTTPDNLVTVVANVDHGGRHDYQAVILQTMPAVEAFTFAA